MIDIILEIIKNTKNYKILAWVFIICVLLLIVLYPIIDANILYYQRIYKRIEILEKVGNIEIEELNNKQLQDEYQAILNEISEKEDKYLNNIFIYKDGIIVGVIKVFSAAWLFVLAAICIPFAKGNKNMTNKAKIGSSLFCLALACGLGYFGYILPTIINVVINVILYNIIIIFLAYTISKASTKN